MALPKNELQFDQSKLTRIQGTKRPANSNMMADLEQLKKREQLASGGELNLDKTPARTTPAKNRNVSQSKKSAPSVGRGKKWAKP